MQSPQITVVVPPSLEDVLEAVTRAVIEKNPDNMIEFFALYFQELVSFQKEHTNLDITELVEKFELISENGDEGLEETTPEFSGESKQRDMCTDTEEDHLLEEPDIQYSSKETQYPSVPSSMAGSKSLPGSDGAPSPAAHELSRSDSFCSVRDVATSVQTLHGDSQTSEGECTPVESAAEDASVSAAGASVESVRSQPSTAGELVPSDSQADSSTTDINQASLVVPLWEEASPPALPPASPPVPKDHLESVPSCHEENGDEGLEETTSEFSGESKQRDMCTDTEEDHLLEEPDIQYSSKETQYPSVPSSTAGSKSLPGSDGAPSPAGPELAYVPAEPAQLAAHLLGSIDSFCSVRDVATSVQTLHGDSQTSEGECTPVESAAEDASVSAAGASVESVRSQPSIAGELVPSDSQADISTTDINQASLVVPLWEEASPPALLPPPVPKDHLEPVLSSNEAEPPSTTEALSLCWDDETIIEADIAFYVEQFPQKIIIPFIDQTAYQLKIEQALNAGQGSSATTEGPSADDLVGQPERTGFTEQVEKAEQVYVMSAMALSAAGQPPPHSNVWTLYCLTDLRQGQKSPPSLAPAGAGVAYFQATPSLSRGKYQQCAPIYVMQEDCKKGDVPPFILVGSNVQNTQDWKPIPSHAVFAQQDAGARRRFITVPVPVARPADEETDTASPSSKSPEETGAKPCTPTVVSVAIPLADVMLAKKGSPAAEKHTG